MFRKQQAHTILNKYIELARRSKDSEMELDLVELRKYLNHLEAQNVGLHTMNQHLNERLEKRFGKY